jgi:hypothetical protein
MPVGTGEEEPERAGHPDRGTGIVTGERGVQGRPQVLQLLVEDAEPAVVVGAAEPPFTGLGDLGEQLRKPAAHQVVGSIRGRPLDAVCAQRLQHAVAGAPVDADRGDQQRLVGQPAKQVE